MAFGGNAADVLIVGSGMAGLMAARTLSQNGIQSLIVDKKASVGGRLSTIRLGSGLGDVGAQFFTARTPEFQVIVDQWMNEDLVYKWSEGWSDGSLGTAAPAGHPRYAVRGGMHALAARLAQDIAVRTSAPLISIRTAGRNWIARASDGAEYTSRAIILTPSVPESLRLLDAGHVQLAPGDRQALDRLTYAPCLVGLLRATGAVRLPEPGAIQQPDAPVSWISDNQRKGISAGAAVITLHASPELSRQLWDATDAEAVAELQKALQPYLDSTTRIVESRIYRWQHAVPTTLHPERYLLAAGLAPLVFAGDAFRWPRVEGAALSGIAAANALMRSLQ
jgi:renalase